MWCCQGLKMYWTYSVLILFTDKRRQKILSSTDMFPFVLRAAVQIPDDSVLSAIPVIIKHSVTNSKFLKGLSESGFLHEYNLAIEEKGDGKYYQQLFDVICCLADIAYVPEFLFYAQTIVKVMNAPELFGDALYAVLALAEHRQCLVYFKKVGLLSYLQDLQQYHTYAEIAGSILDRVE